MARGLARIIRNAADPPDPLTPLVEEYLLARKWEPDALPPTRPVSRGGRFGFSGFGCQRAAAFNFMQVPSRKRADTTLEVTFGIGNWLHRMWQSYFKDMERVLGSRRFSFYGYEVWTYVEKFYAGGSMDVFCAIEGVDAIIDVKTARDNMYRERVLNGPDPEHVKQLNRYLRSQGIQLGLLFYLNKNDSEFVVYVVEYSKPLWLEDTRWLRACIGYLQQEELPPMDPGCTKASKMAQDCKWAHLCYRSPERNLQHALYRGKPPFTVLWEESLCAITASTSPEE